MSSDQKGKDETDTVARAETSSEISLHYDLPGWYRWVIVVTFTVMCVFVGPTYMNWPPMEKMFNWSNAYAHLCTPGSEGFELRPHGEIYCKEKDRAIAAMYPAAVSTMFACDLLAGIILDSLGGKICTLFGLTLQIVGWLLLAFSSESFHAYMPGIVIMAVGVDPTFFGLISSANLFPGWNSTIMGILGGARSISFANGLIMEKIWNQKETVNLRGISLVFSLLLAVWWVFALVCIPIQTYPKLATGKSLDTEPGEGKISYRSLLHKRPVLSWSGLKPAVKEQWSGFIEHAWSWNYLVLCILPIIVFIRNNYYGSSYKEHLPNSVDFFSVMNPLSMLPCPFLGLLADRFSAALTVAFLGICGTFSMLFVMFYSSFWEYFSVMLNWVYISFIASQFYVLTAFCYPQNQMGKLVGFVLLLGGLVSLVSTQMYNFSSKNNSFVAMDITIVALCALSFVMAVFLYFVLERPIRRKAKLDAVAAKCDAMEIDTATKEIV